MFTFRGLLPFLVAILWAELSVAVRKQVEASQTSRDESVMNSTEEAEWGLGFRRPVPTGYVPGDQLKQPSNAPLMTFYMYRSEGPPEQSSYDLVNVNAASIGGVMWYLHHEIIFTCTGAGGLLGSRAGGTGILGQRKFDITRIKRIKVTVKATQPLADRGMHFSTLCSFDGGQCTGPFRDGKSPMGEYDQFGFTVGCGRVGDWPHSNWPSGKKYPNAIWYSLPGQCPTMHYQSVTDKCKQEQPGGRCKPGEMPTGTGDCTYQYEDAGDVNIDDIVGITPKWANRAEFCAQCKTEGDGYRPGGCGLNFWGNNLYDEAANHRQVEAALREFEKKYPDSPKDASMPAPCDWNRWAYNRWPWH